MATLCVEDLHTKLQNYCNWNSLPTELLSDIKGDKTTASHDADATLAAFITHLTALLPFEWSVTQHATFPSGNSSSSSSTNRLQATMHPAAVGTADGIMVFGGLQLGRLAEVKVENEASWIKESMPAGLAPDCSRVYQVRTGHTTHVEQCRKTISLQNKANSHFADPDSLLDKTVHLKGMATAPSTRAGMPCPRCARPACAQTTKQQHRSWM